MNAFLNSIDCTNKKQNIEIYQKKDRQRTRFSMRLNKKIEEKIIYKVKKKYVWNKQYE